MVKSTKWRRMLFAAAIALAAASCSAAKPRGPEELPSIKLTPAPSGSCRIDGVKMCRELGAGGETVDFQIPAGQSIKLTCYVNRATGAIGKADAAPESALTYNSVDYLKSRGFCAP